MTVEKPLEAVDGTIFADMDGAMLVGFCNHFATEAVVARCPWAETG